MILVTGASGLLGTHLLQELAKQPMPVVALYHQRKPNLEAENIIWKQCNLLSIEQVEDVLKGVEFIYHCAAVVSYKAKDKDWVISNNINATANLVNIALEQGVKHVVHVSSIAALGGLSEHKNALISETTYWTENKHNTAYSISKYRSEMEVWRANAEGLSVSIINPGIIIGEGDWAYSSPAIFKQVAKEFPYYTEGINAWVDVKDVVQAMLLLMEKRTNGERYVLSVGNFTYKDIFVKIANALGVKPPSRKATKWMTELVWRLAALKGFITGKAPFITKETARNAIAERHYDNSKFLQHFPEFKYSEIDNSISRTAAYFSQQKL